MSLANLIRKRENKGAANANPAKAANDGASQVAGLAKLAPLALANAPTDLPALLVGDPRAATTASPRAIFDRLAAEEARRLRVLNLLSANPTATYAVVTDDSEPKTVLITLAIRDRAT